METKRHPVCRWRHEKGIEESKVEIESSANSIEPFWGRVASQNHQMSERVDGRPITRRLGKVFCRVKMLRLDLAIFRPTADGHEERLFTIGLAGSSVPVKSFLEWLL